MRSRLLYKLLVEEGGAKIQCSRSLQNRVAMMAKHDVQKSIKRAVEEYPVFIFGGVFTFIDDDIGRLLKSFGIKSPS